MSEQKIFSFKPVSFLTSESIPISFIIHAKDQFSNISNILQSIFGSKNPFEVILVNNNSCNNEYFNELSSNFKFLKLVKSKLTFSEAFNEALDLCEANWIFYINADFVPHNIMWLNSIINSMMSLKSSNVKLISPFVNNFSFFESYKDIKEDTILTNHFLPFKAAFFHRDLFKAIGKLDPSDDMPNISKNLFQRMSKRNFKQAICPSSIFIA